MEFFKNKNGLSLIILLIISGIALAPLLQNINSHIPGEPNKTGDAPIFLFNAFDLKNHINENSNPIFSKNINYPLENNLLFNSHSVLLSLFTIMFDNPARGINIFIYLMYILSSIGAYYLFKNYGLNNFLSLLGSILWTFSSYKFMQLQTHLSLICTAPIPFYLLTFPKIFTSIKPIKISFKYLIICGLIGIWSVSLEYYQSFFLIYYSIFYIIYLLRKDKVKLKSLKLLWLIPVILFISKIGVDTLNGLGFNNMGALWWSPDLFALFIPINNPFILENFNETISQIPPHKENYVFLGLPLWIAIFTIIIYAIKNKIKGNNSYLLVFSVLYFMFTFPEFSFLGKRLVNSPGAFIYYIPGLNHVRVPGRYILMFGIFFIPQILIYIQNINNKLLNISLFLAGCLGALPWFGINQIEIQSYKSELQEISTDSSIKLILPYPVGIKDGSIEHGKFLTTNFIAQYYHQKPIIGGYLSRIPEEHFNYYTGYPSMNKLLKLSEGNLINFDSSDLKELRNKFPFDYILLDKDYKNSATWEIFRASFSEGNLDSIMSSEHYIHYRIIDIKN